MEMKKQFEKSNITISYDSWTFLIPRINLICQRNWSVLINIGTRLRFEKHLLSEIFCVINHEITILRETKPTTMKNIKVLSLQWIYGRKLDSPFVFRNCVSSICKSPEFLSKAKNMAMLAATQKAADCLLFEYSAYF